MAILLDSYIYQIRNNFKILIGQEDKKITFSIIDRILLTICMHI